MSQIIQLKNEAAVFCDGSVCKSNTVITDLTLLPVVVKRVDRPDAGLYDRLTYHLTITNPGAVPLVNLLFCDELPAGCVFVEGSFYADGNPVSPQVCCGNLKYTVPLVEGGESITLTFQVQIVRVLSRRINRGCCVRVGCCIYAPYQFYVSNVPRLYCDGKWTEGEPAVTGVEGWIRIRPKVLDMMIER